MTNSSTTKVSMPLTGSRKVCGNGCHNPGYVTCKHSFPEAKAQVCKLLATPPNVHAVSRPAFFWRLAWKSAPRGFILLPPPIIVLKENDN